MKVSGEQILEYMRQGLNNSDIARQLGMTPGNLNHRCQELRKRFGIKNPTQRGAKKMINVRITQEQYTDSSQDACFASRERRGAPWCNALVAIQTGCGTKKCHFYKSRKEYIAQCNRLKVAATAMQIER